MLSRNTEQTKIFDMAAKRIDVVVDTDPLEAASNQTYVLSHNGFHGKKPEELQQELTKLEIEMQ